MFNSETIHDVDVATVKQHMTKTVAEGEKNNKKSFLLIKAECKNETRWEKLPCEAFWEVMGSCVGFKVPETQHHTKTQGMLVYLLPEETQTSARIHIKYVAYKQTPAAILT